MTNARLLRAAPWVIGGAGLAWCLALVASIPGPVFSNGDGGMRWLLVQQALSGYFGPELRLPAESWVEELWAKGLYPFGPPFVFEDGGRRIQAFPVFFAWLCAPFQALIGWRGLYVVPVLAAVATCVRFHVLCRQLGVAEVARIVALAALVFASPLAIYAATFWEHTLAAALTLFGTAEVLLVVDGRAQRRRLAAGGVLLGLAGWLRPENFVFAIVTAVVVVVLLRRTRRADAVRFAVATAVALAGFCAWNLWFTGRPLGYHAASAADGSQDSHLLAHWGSVAGGLLHLLANTCTLALVGLVVAPWRLLRQRDSRHAAWLLVASSVLVGLVVPLLAPLHHGGLCWGPRYWLSFVPLCFLLAVWPAGGERGARRFAVAAAVTGALLWGGHTNVVAGTEWLRFHQGPRIWPTLQVMQQQPESFVVVNEQFTVQELASLTGEKTFLWVTEPGGIETVARTLRDRGAPGFLIVLAVWSPEQIEAARAGGGANIRIDSVPTRVTLLDTLGCFVIYRVAFAR